MSSGGELLFALYLRDAFSISSPVADAIPRLTPAVTAVPAPPLEPASLGRRWDRWWAELTESPAPRGVPGILELLGDREPELRTSCSRWSTARREERERAGLAHTRDVVPVQEVVARVCRELGRERVLFDLSVEEVPVEGAYWHRLSREWVLASTELLHSPRAAEELHAIIRELVEF